MSSGAVASPKEICPMPTNNTSPPSIGSNPFSSRRSLIVRSLDLSAMSQRVMRLSAMAGIWSRSARSSWSPKNGPSHLFQSAAMRSISGITVSSQNASRASA